MRTSRGSWSGRRSGPRRAAGWPAAAAFLERSAALTLDPARRAERALAAAQATYQAGAFEATLALLATAEAGPPDQLGDSQCRGKNRRRVTFIGHILTSCGLLPARSTIHSDIPRSSSQ